MPSFGGSFGATIDVSEMESLPKGALIVGDGSGAPSIFPAGSDGESLIFDSTQPAGVRAGTPAGTDANYVHNQAVAAATWVVIHNLAKRVSPVIVDSSGAVVVGDIQYDSANQITLSFSAAFAGKCYCN